MLSRDDLDIVIQAARDALKSLESKASDMGEGIIDVKVIYTFPSGVNYNDHRVAGVELCQLKDLSWFIEDRYCFVELHKWAEDGSLIKDKRVHEEF